MTDTLDKIIENAQTGHGPCSGCPAHADSGGQNVNPGLLNYDADLMFYTLDPSHSISWQQYDDWEEYNDEYARKFANWRGGRRIQRMIAPLNLGLSDVWLGDTIKCPVDNSLRTLDTQSEIDQAAAQCSQYLVQEVEEVNPHAIVSMGEATTQRLLKTVFDITPGSLKTGTRDCGKIYNTDPPLVVSPHWSHGWLDRSPHGKPNLEIVQDALLDTYPET